MATYYVDTTRPNDLGDGLSEGAAWKTIAKVNSSSFNAGDFILFKRGQTWREQLIVPSSGSAAGGYITFYSYGSGDNPIISMATVVSVWADLGLPGKSVWQGSLPAANDYFGLARNGVRATSNYNLYPPEFTVDAMEDGWFRCAGWDGVFQYRRDAGNPGACEVGTRRNCITIDNKNYIIIDGIDCHGPCGTPGGGASGNDDAAISCISIANTCDHITIRNLTARNSSRFGVIAGDYTADQNNTNITFDNLSSYGHGDTGIELNGSGVVQNCIVYNCGTNFYDIADRGGIGCYVSTAAGITIQNNIVFNINRSDGGYIGNSYHDPAITVSEAVGPVKVLRNYIHDVHVGGIQVNTSASSGNQVAYNIIVNYGDCTYAPSSLGKHAGMKLGAGGAGLFKNALIANNVIAFGQQTLASGEAGIFIDNADQLAMMVKNNILFSNVCTDVVLRSGGGAMTGGAFTNNLYYKAGGYAGNWDWAGAVKDTLLAWQAVCAGGDANALATDPLFLNAGGSYALVTDFKLPSTSPAADAGVNVGLTTDYWGNTVPALGKYPIGAFMYQYTVAPSTFPPPIGSIINFFRGLRRRRLWAQT